MNAIRIAAEASKAIREQSNDEHAAVQRRIESGGRKPSNRPTLSNSLQERAQDIIEPQAVYDPRPAFASENGRVIISDLLMTGRTYLGSMTAEQKAALDAKMREAAGRHGVV